jgi:hypothetical protein
MDIGQPHIELTAAVYVATICANCLPGKSMSTAHCSTFCTNTAHPANTAHCSPLCTHTQPTLQVRAVQCSTLCTHMQPTAVRSANTQTAHSVLATAHCSTLHKHSPLQHTQHTHPHTLTHSTLCRYMQSHKRAKNLLISGTGCMGEPGAAALHSAVQCSAVQYGFAGSSFFVWGS